MEIDNHFSITEKTKSRLPRLPFLVMKNKILGKRYVLSLVSVGQKRAQALNTAHRKKNKPANVLAFPLSGNEGEIFMCLSKIKKDTSLFFNDALKKDAYVRLCGLMFIHGLLHLKGLKHNSTMEKEEARYLNYFNFS